MARIEISKMKRIHKSSIRFHDIVMATYDIYEIDGRKILQIDTYGRPERENTQNISQSIQIDENNVMELIDLLKKNFNLE